MYSLISAIHLRRSSQRPLIARLIHRFPAKNSRIIAIEHAGNRVATRNDFLYMLTIEPACFGIGVEENCPFVVDAVAKLIVCGIVDSGPAKVLCDAAGVAPPISQAKLDVKIVLRRLCATTSSR